MGASSQREMQGGLGWLQTRRIVAALNSDVQNRYQIWGTSDSTDINDHIYKDIDNRSYKYVVLVCGVDPYAEIRVEDSALVLRLFDREGGPMLHSEWLGNTDGDLRLVLDHALDAIANFAMSLYEHGNYLSAANFAAKARTMADDDRRTELAWALVSCAGSSL